MYTELVKKNMQFTRLLKGNGRLREFNFRKVEDRQGLYFTIDVNDDRGFRMLFVIQKNENSWKITPKPLPDWVFENEQHFHSVIEEELGQTLFKRKAKRN